MSENKEIKNLKAELFDIKDVENWKNFLNQNGYVVLKDILQKEEIEKAMFLFKKSWNHVSPNFNWNDKKTWKTENSPIIWSKGSATFSGFGQSEFMWFLRNIKNIKIPFCELYKTQDLSVSLDGFSVFLSSTQKSSRWLHIDQNPNNKHLCYQGSYNLLPVNDDSSGFIVVPESQLTYKPSIDHNKDWILIDENDIHQDKVYKLLIPENCFTIWNSKTIHANTGIYKKKGTKNITRLDRVTAYISFQPSSRIDPLTKKKRINGYKNGETTSHWVHKYEKKILPFHVKKIYNERNFNDIIPSLNENNEIPENFYNLL